MSSNQLEHSGSQRTVALRTTEELIEEMQEEQEAAERKQLLKGMTPAFKEKLEYINDWFRKTLSDFIRSRYELGLQVRELYDDETNNGGKIYGKNAIARICKLLNWDDGVIRQALRFVQIITPADLERLCAMVMPNGEPLNWSHVRILLPIEDQAKRAALLDRTVQEGWTCNELAREVKRLADGTPKDQRGRPPRVPKDFDGAVTSQQQLAEQWDRLYQRVWNVPTLSLATHAAHLAPDQVTEERLRHARELAWQLRQVANQAHEQAEKAEQVVLDFERILDQRRQVETPLQARTAPVRKERSRAAAG